MAMYSVAISDVTATAVQDVFHLKAGATYPIIIHAVELNQKGLTAAEALNVKLKRHTATVTQGSGGSTPTPAVLAGGAASSGITAHANDTTQASAGTITTLFGLTFQLLNGLFWMPSPEMRPIISVSTGFIVDLATAPSASMKLSGYIVYEEPGL